MQSNEAILVVLLVVLIVGVVFWSPGGSWGGGCAAGAPAPPCCQGKKGSFTPSDQTMSPYTPLEMQTGALRGARHDAYNQPHAYTRANLAKNYRAWAASPRDLEEAQRAAWFEATASGGGSDNYNPEMGGNPADEMMQHFAPAPSINYQDTLVDLVADPRMRAQQANWASEVAPKSQSALKVDTIDEAAAISAQHGHGLYAFRFAGSRVAQHNPLFVTDQDADSYAHHTTEFTFGG